MSKKNIKYIPRLLTHYKEKSIPELMKKLNIQNVNRIPKLEKVVINIGIGDARDNANALKNTVSELSLISGQKPVVAQSKKPISNLATVGIYFFRTGKMFCEAAIDMILENDRVNNEFYTCPV